MGDVRLNLEGLNLAKAAVSKAAEKTVRALAFAVQEQAIENIREAGAIDTGALVNSIYVETSEEHQRATALAAARGAALNTRGKVGRKRRRRVRVLEAIQEAIPGDAISDRYHARVASCVEHGIYVEMGVTASATGDHAPRPFLHPAAATVQEKAGDVLKAFLSEELGGSRI